MSDWYDAAKQYGVAIALVVCPSTGRWLMERRGKDVRYPHTWGLPGGALEPGETFPEAANRELAEEAGIHNARYRTQFQLTDHEFKVTCVVFVVDKETKPRKSKESDVVTWVDEFPDDLIPVMTRDLPKYQAAIDDAKLPRDRAASLAQFTPAFRSWFGRSVVVDHSGKPMRMYHGTASDIKEFKREYLGKGHDQQGSGFYFTSDPENANTYAVPKLELPDTGAGNNIIPVYLRILKPVGNKPLTTAQIHAIISAGDPEALYNFGDVDFEGRAKVIRDAVLSYTNYEHDVKKALFALSNDFYDGDEGRFLEVVTKVTGYDGIVVHHGDVTHAVVFHPNQIKSVYNPKPSIKRAEINAAAEPSEPATPDEQWEILYDSKASAKVGPYTCRISNGHVHVRRVITPNLAITALVNIRVRGAGAASKGRLVVYCTSFGREAMRSNVTRTSRVDIAGSDIEIPAGLPTKTALVATVLRKSIEAVEMDLLRAGISVHDGKLVDPQCRISFVNASARLDERVWIERPGTIEIGSATVTFSSQYSQNNAKYVAQARVTIPGMHGSRIVVFTPCLGAHDTVGVELTFDRSGAAPALLKLRLHTDDMTYTEIAQAVVDALRADTAVTAAAEPQPHGTETGVVKYVRDMADKRGTDSDLQMQATIAGHPITVIFYDVTDRVVGFTLSVRLGMIQAIFDFTCKPAHTRHVTLELTPESNSGSVVQVIQSGSHTHRNIVVSHRDRYTSTIADDIRSLLKAAVTIALKLSPLVAPTATSADQEIAEAAAADAGRRTHKLNINESRVVRFPVDYNVLKHDPLYRKAKSGDADAAADMLGYVTDNATSARISRLFNGCVFVAPHAVEASGRNAIPQILADVCAYLANGHVDRGIVQVNKVGHTGSGLEHRFMSRALFEGAVRPAKYVLVDDNITSGATLADLGSYINSRGGEVVGIIALTSSSKYTKLYPTPQKHASVRNRFGKEKLDALLHDHGLSADTLTAPEVEFLSRHGDADEVRDRLAKEAQSRSRRSARVLRRAVQEGTASQKHAEGSVAGGDAVPSAGHADARGDRLAKAVQAGNRKPSGSAHPVVHGIAQGTPRQNSAESCVTSATEPASAFDSLRRLVLAAPQNITGKHDLQARASGIAVNITASSDPNMSTDTVGLIFRWPARPELFLSAHLYRDGRVQPVHSEGLPRPAGVKLPLRRLASPRAIVGALVAFAQGAATTQTHAAAEPRTPHGLLAAIDHGTADEDRGLVLHPNVAGFKTKVTLQHRESVGDVFIGVTVVHNDIEYMFDFVATPQEGSWLLEFDNAGGGHALCAIEVPGSKIEFKRVTTKRSATAPDNRDDVVRAAVALTVTAVKVLAQKVQRPAQAAAEPSASAPSLYTRLRTAYPHSVELHPRGARSPLYLRVDWSGTSTGEITIMEQEPVAWEDRVLIRVHGVTKPGAMRLTDGLRYHAYMTVPGARPSRAPVGPVDVTHALDRVTDTTSKALDRLMAQLYRHFMSQRKSSVHAAVEPPTTSAPLDFAKNLYLRFGKHGDKSLEFSGATFQFKLEENPRGSKSHPTTLIVYGTRRDSHKGTLCNCHFVGNLVVSTGKVYVDEIYFTALYGGQMIDIVQIPKRTPQRIPSVANRSLPSFTKALLQITLKQTDELLGIDPGNTATTAAAEPSDPAYRIRDGRQYVISLTKHKREWTVKAWGYTFFLENLVDRVNETADVLNVQIRVTCGTLLATATMTWFKNDDTVTLGGDPLGGSVSGIPTSKFNMTTWLDQYCKGMLIKAKQNLTATTGTGKLGTAYSASPTRNGFEIRLMRTGAVLVNLTKDEALNARVRYGSNWVGAMGDLARHNATAAAEPSSVPRSMLQALHAKLKQNAKLIRIGSGDSRVFVRLRVWSSYVRHAQVPNPADIAFCVDVSDRNMTLDPTNPVQEIGVSTAVVRFDGAVVMRDPVSSGYETYTPDIRATELRVYLDQMIRFVAAKRKHNSDVFRARMHSAQEKMAQRRVSEDGTAEGSAPNPPPETVGKALRTALRSDEAYTLLDRLVDGADTWAAGGCALLATALHKLGLGPVVVLEGCLKATPSQAEGPHQVQHWLAQAHGGFYDADGFSTHATLIRRWNREEGIIRAAVRAPVAADYRSSTYTPVRDAGAKIDDLVDFLREHLPTA